MYRKRVTMIFEEKKHDQGLKESKNLVQDHLIFNHEQT